MGSLLKKLVSTPTNSLHNDYGIHLDLSYITNRIIVCSCPVSKLTKLAYRNSINDLVNYLQLEHPGHWSIWNLKLESPNDYCLTSTDIQNRIHRFPWPDHQPPPFRLLLDCLSSIDTYLRANDENIVVIHCKMGKGRSGLVVCAYLLLYLNLSKRDARDLFTLKRMKPGFGSGVSIISQLKFLSYCELYSKVKIYSPKKIAHIESIKVHHDQSIYIPLKIFCAGYTSNDEVMQYFELGPSHIVSRNDAFSIYRVNELVEDQDIQITVKPTEKASVFHSTVSTWFNLHWELNKIEHETSPNEMIIHLYWDKMDGFKGTSLKGKQLFEAVSIKIKLIDI